MKILLALGKLGQGSVEAGDGDIIAALLGAYRFEAPLDGVLDHLLDVIDEIVDLATQVIDLCTQFVVRIVEVGGLLLKIGNQTLCSLDVGYN